MHSLLESYLSEVAAHLSALPIKRRNEELREMRAHLENALIVSRERGQTEDEAAQSVVAQFGPPTELGENVVWAWQRGLARERRSFWGATAVTTLMLCLSGMAPVNLLRFDYWRSGVEYTMVTLLLDLCGINHLHSSTAVVQGMFLVDFGLAGLIAGTLFPKRAIWGVCLGMALTWLASTAMHSTAELRALTSMDGLIHQGRGGWILMAIVSAWAASWLRLTWSNKRLARA
jgi:hypothetical protein